jgi:hypothetical protein
LQRDVNDLALIEFLPSFLAKMEERLEEYGLGEEHCWTWASCEASRPGLVFKANSIGFAIQELQR